MVRQGAIDNQPKTPFILGFECAGEVEVVGEGVEGFAVGDRVAALVEQGAWAELVAAPAKHVYKLPKGMSFNVRARFAYECTSALPILTMQHVIHTYVRRLLYSPNEGCGRRHVELCGRASFAV